MTPPDDRLAALIEAHRRVRRPPPQLQARISAALADEEDPGSAAPARGRWVESVAISVALAAAALLLLHWVAGPSSPRERLDDGDAARQQAAFEAKDADASGHASPRPSAASPRPNPPADAPAANADADAPVPTLAAPPAPSSRPPARAPSTPARDDGTLEVRLLRDAEVALAKDPADAWRKLTEHASRFPDSTLAVERQALFTLAACASRASDATARRDAFLSAHPGSAYAARVRAACPR